LIERDSAASAAAPAAGQQNLCGMVMDAPGLELHEHAARQGGHDHRGRHRKRPRQLPGEAGDSREQADMQGERKHDAGEPFGAFGRQNHREKPYEQSQRQVQNAGPMHLHAVRGIEPVLMQIEPGLAGEPVAHFDEAHGVVRIGESAAPPDLDGVRPGNRQREQQAERAQKYDGMERRPRAARRGGRMRRVDNCNRHALIPRTKSHIAARKLADAPRFFTNAQLFPVND
jgi:hypothetical protein